MVLEFLSCYLMIYFHNYIIINIVCAIIAPGAAFFQSCDMKCVCVYRQREMPQDRVQQSPTEFNRVQLQCTMSLQTDSNQFADVSPCLIFTFVNLQMLCCTIYKFAV